MSHTKGPWTVECLAHTVRVVCNVGDDLVGDDICIIGSVFTEQAKANAQLIAAAPELLEVCKLMVAPVKGMTMADYQRILNQARAAIRKAEAPQ